jgi:hypothetical protein
VVRLQEANFHINKSTSSALALRKANFEQRIDVPHALCKKRRTLFLLLKPSTTGTEFALWRKSAFTQFIPSRRQSRQCPISTVASAACEGERMNKQRGVAWKR